jgi:carbon starvation protein
VIPRFADPSWRIGAWISTAVVVAAWGSLLLMGVTDPRGGIQTLYPLFGIANQLIAAVALLVVTVMVVRKGYARWAWIPIIPLVFDTVVTFTASWQKIFSHDPALGYWQQWRDARSLLTTLTDPEEIAVERAIVRNTFIQGTLSIVFLVTVAFVMVCGIIRIVRTLRTGDTTTSEDPRQESNFFAPTTMISTALDKKCVAEYEVVGDPALIPGLKQADRASRQTAGTATETGS